MAVFHRYAGPCRNPKCNRTVRSNGFTVYCWSCTAIDIRYGDPRQRRITQKALTKPLAAVAHIPARPCFSAAGCPSRVRNLQPSVVKAVPSGTCGLRSIRAWTSF